MRILFVAARICFPLNTGAKIRAFHILRSLSARHDVTMAAYYGRRDEKAHFREFERMGVRLVPVFNPRIDGPPTASSALRSISGGLPLTVAKYYSGAMMKEMGKLSAQRFDAVHCEHLHVYPMAKAAGRPLVLDSHNVESQIAGRYAALERDPVRKALLSWNHRKLQKFEMAAVKAADLVLTVSEEDRRTFGTLGAGDNMRVLDNGVDVEYFRPSAEEERAEVVFVGSMDWKPNIDGVEFFLDEVLPLIRRTHPDTAVSIVGKSPPERLVRRAETERGLTVTGTVSDVRPFVGRAAVCVVPLRVGGGTRLKVLEGFAMGKAVVSTALGCEGIACRDGEHMLVAGDAPSFARAVVSLLDDRGLRRSLGANARRLAEREYDWDAIGKRLAGYYDDLVAKIGRQDGRRDAHAR